MPAFPERLEPDRNGRVYVGADLQPATIIEAYRRGLFPWRGGPAIPWYCPDPRAVLPVGAIRIARSLARRARDPDLVIAFDRDLRGAIERCATTPRRREATTWIAPDVIDAYAALGEPGIAHCVEVYRAGVPVGGLYGVTFGSIFHGESMYFRERDASKLALAALARAGAAHGLSLIDCQVPTSHLERLGAERWPRERYLAYLASDRAPSLHRSWADWG